MGYYIPDPYDHKQQHIVAEILEDQIQKLINENTNRESSENGHNGKKGTVCPKKPVKNERT